MNTTTATATLTAPAYIPRTGTLAERVLAYFRQYPYAELRTSEVAQMFEVPTSSVQACLEAAVNSGVLVFEMNEDLKYTYTLGVNPGARTARKGKDPAAPNETKAVLPTPAPAPAPAPSPAITAADPAPATPQPATTNATTPSLEAIAALQVETGIPLGSGSNRSGASKWQPLFAKLTAPNTSVAIPREWKTAVAADAAKRNAKARKSKGLPTYRVAYINATQARVWRVA
jgi:hypothetical protein